MDETPVGTVRVGGPRNGSRGASLVVAAILGFLAAAILKPWSFGQPAATPAPSVGGGPVAVASGTPGAPTPTPRPPDPNGIDCLTDHQVQVVWLERTPNGEVRSWVVVPVPAATGPTDPAMGVVPVYSGRVVGLGICTGEPAGSGAGPAPSDGSAATLAVLHGVFLDVVLTQSGGQAPTVDLGVPTVVSNGASSPDAAIVYGAPQRGGIHPGASAGPGGSSGTSQPPVGGPAQATWAVGSYAISFRFDGEAADIIHWLRVDVRPTAGTG